jgi:hypothetical protein
MADTAAEYRKLARQALLPGDGLNRPTASKLHEADIHASLAKAVEMGRIADALEALAANTTPTAAAPVLQAAVHHSH